MAEVLKLLCVDDDEDILFVTSLSLERDSDIIVHSTSSPMESLEILGNAETRIDGVILDVHMPGMGGVDVLAKLRSLPNHAHTPVIFLTARIRHPDMAGYAGLDVVGVIAKPYNPLTLAAEVREMLAKRRRKS